jgi:hypothetical protein
LEDIIQGLELKKVATDAYDSVDVYNKKLISIFNNCGIDMVMKRFEERFSFCLKAENDQWYYLMTYNIRYN